MNQIVVVCLVVIACLTGSYAQADSSSSSSSNSRSMGEMGNVINGFLPQNLPLMNGNFPTSIGQGNAVRQFGEATGSGQGMLSSILCSALRLPGRAIQMAGDGITNLGSVVSNVGGRLAGQPSGSSSSSSSSSSQNGIMDTITGPLRNLPGMRSGSDALNGISNQAQGAINQAQESASRMANRAQESASQMGNRAQNLASYPQEALSNFGSQAQQAASVPQAQNEASQSA